jgi:hypothetical protein
MMIHKAPATFRPQAVAIIRECALAQPTGDLVTVAAHILHAGRGLPKREGLRLTTTIAWLAGYIASRLPPDELDALLRDVEELQP